MNNYGPWRFEKYMSTFWTGPKNDVNEVEITRHLSALVGFGVYDNKGREVGARVSIEERADRPGMYAVRSFAARGGESFGAIPRASYFAAPSLDVAKTFAVTKIEASRKRAVKAWGLVAPKAR